MALEPTSAPSIIGCANGPVAVKLLKPETGGVVLEGGGEVQAALEQEVYMSYSLQELQLRHVVKVGGGGRREERLARGRLSV